jgi:hypothetical protein
MKKFCPKCKIKKDIDDFSVDKRQFDKHRCYCKQCCRKYTETYHKEHPERQHEYDRTIGREKSLKRLYNLTKDQFNELLIKQGNKCAICGEIFIKTPYVDHDHLTGKVRGLLCRKHNFMLANADDSITILNNGIKYLEANRSLK